MIKILTISGVRILEYIFISVAILLKLNTEDLNGLLYLKQMIGVSEL